MNRLNRPAKIIRRLLQRPFFNKPISAKTMGEKPAASSCLRKQLLYFVMLMMCLLGDPGPAAAVDRAESFKNTAQGVEESVRKNVLKAIELPSTLVKNATQTVEIVIEGVEGNARKNVLTALELPYGLVKDGKADRLWLERFASQARQKVLTALEPFGYYSAHVIINIETPEVDTYRIQVKVETGPPAILTDVSISITGAGASESSLLALVSAFPLQKGAVLLHQPYEQARQTLQTRAQELGYLDAEYTVHEIRIDEPGRSARIALTLQTGERYYFSDITLKGAPDYPDTFLRRYLTFVPGNVFSYTKLAESQLQLNNSERFREVAVLAEKEQAREFKVPVSVLLKPAPPKSLRPGVGYGTDTGARFALRYRDLNMLQKGHELNSHLYVSERLQGLTTNYIIPSDKDIRSYTSAQINLQKEDITTYNSQLISLELARTNSFGNQKQGTAYIKFQQEEFTIGVQDSSSRYVLPGIRFSDNHYDSLIRPHRGFRYAIDLRGTDEVMGSTTQLLQLLAEASHVLPLPWRLSLSTSAKTAVTFFSDPISDLPPSLRFFAGGDQSVRGYAYQSLGPRDASGNVVGGKHLLTGCVELQRAILEDWAVSAFYNAGNAFDTFNNLTLYQAAGAGIHYFTPVGALNLSVARQIRVDDPGIRLHFTVGFEF